MGMPVGDANNIRSSTMRTGGYLHFPFVEALPDRSTLGARTWTIGHLAVQSCNLPTTGTGTGTGLDWRTFRTVRYLKVTMSVLENLISKLSVIPAFLFSVVPPFSFYRCPCHRPVPRFYVAVWEELRHSTFIQGTLIYPFLSNFSSMVQHVFGHQEFSNAYFFLPCSVLWLLYVLPCGLIELSKFRRATICDSEYRIAGVFHCAIYCDLVSICWYGSDQSL